MAIENSSGDKRSGQHYDPRNDRVERFTEQILAIAEANALLGSNRTEIIPHDKISALVRIYTPPTADIEAFVDSTPGTVNLRLPDTLTGITVTFNTNEQDGAGSHSAGTALGQGAGSFNFQPRATAQGSASILPDVQIDIEQVWSENVPCMKYGFYMLVGSTRAQILARLTAIAAASVLAWPNFRPVSHTLTLKGQQISLQQMAEADERFWYNAEHVWGYQYSSGESYSKSGDVTIRSIRIPPTIHGAITITGATSTASVTTTVAVHIPSVFSDVPDPDITLAAVDNAPTPITKTANGSVSPTSLSATSPTGVPTSGIYLLDIAPAESEWGYTFLKATVVDFADLV